MNLEDGSPPLSNHVGGPSQHTSILAQGATLSTQMKKRVEEKVQAIGSEIPIYVKEMTEISSIGSKCKGRGCRTYPVVSLPTRLSTVTFSALFVLCRWLCKLTIG